MDVSLAVARLRSQAASISALLQGVDDERARWRPAPGVWSLVEVVNHLADEESEDFRARVASTLDDPARPWEPIDPEGAVVARGHGERSLEPSLQRFVDERGVSLAWLADLWDADWTRTHEHAQLGPLRAGDLLVSWVAHDQLHLRQLVTRLVELTRRDGAPFTIDYAEP